MTDQTQSTTWSQDRVADVLRALAKEDELPEHLITAKITGQDSVETLGLDSLGAVYLIERLEIEAGIELPDDFLDFGDTVAVIAERMTQLATGAE